MCWVMKRSPSREVREWVTATSLCYCSTVQVIVCAHPPMTRQQTLMTRLQQLHLLHREHTMPLTSHTHTSPSLIHTPNHSPITLPLSHLSPTPLFSPIITPLTTQASNGVDGVMFIVFLTYTMIPFSLRVSTLLCTLLSVAHIIISAVVAITLHIQLAPTVILRQVSLYSCQLSVCSTTAVFVLPHLARD